MNRLRAKAANLVLVLASVVFVLIDRLARRLWSE